MKIGEMGARLKEEFPGKYISFAIEVDYHGTFDADKDPEVEVKIYEPSVGFIEAPDFETCVRLLKDRLYSLPADKTLDVDFAS